MSSKVAVLVINDILPADRIEQLLEVRGYSCITLDRLSKTIELPVFNLCMVGIGTPSQYQIANKVLANTDGVILFYCEKQVKNISKDFKQVPDSNILESNFTGKELDLAIELQLLKKQVEKAEKFSGREFNTNHVRLKKILPEEQAWRIIFEQSPNGVLLSDDEGNIIYTNTTAAELLGYEPEELIKMRVHELVPEDILPQVDINIQKILRCENLTTEVFNIRKDGSKRYVLLHESRVIFPNGKYGIMTISTDITRAKKAEEALRESMETYKTLVENSNDGIVFIKDGLITYGNPKIIEELKTTPEELINQPIDKFVHPSQKELIVERYKNRLEGKDEPNIYETILCSSNGECIPVEFNVNLIEQGNEKVALVFTRNITARKEAEKALRESEESYKGLFNNSSEGILILDVSGVILDANKSGQVLLGFSKDELLGKTLLELTDQSKFKGEELMRSIRLAYQGHEQRFEFWGVKSDGVSIPMDMLLNSGDYFGLKVVFAMCHDITEQKNSEEVLRESEEKYRTLTEQIPVGLYRILNDGQIIYCNPAFAKIFGFKTPDEAIGFNIKVLISDFENWVLTCSTTTTPIETQMQTISGNKIWVQNILQPNISEHPDTSHFDGMLTDISDRKQAIDELVESEAKFKAMLLAIPDQLFRISSKGILIDFAPSEKLFFPQITNEHLGKNISSIFPENIYKKYAEAIEYINKTGKLQRFEYSYKYQKETFFYEARTIPASNDIFLVLLRDITQQKKFEEEIRVLAQTIMNANDSISITDLDGKFIYTNPAFTKIYGYSQTEILGKTAEILKPAGSQKIGNEIHEQTLKGGWQGEVLNVKKDGTVFPIFLSTSPIYNEFNEVIATVGIANDITERKLIEQELIRAKEQAEESDRLKTAFLSNMSHEIRSPMNAVLGFIQLIKAEEELSENGKQYIELIENSGNQLLSLIEDIIDISKIQSNQIKIAKTYFELNELFNELYKIYSNVLKSKEDQKTILLKPEVTQDSPFTIYSDPIRIRQILTNLLSNAIKFTPSGKISFGYSIVVDEVPYIQFYVKDTGIGISPEKQALIFERFRQADDSYTRLYGGSGLGLAISKGLVDLLGGNIWVESTEGEGSTFYFTIPYQDSESELEEHSNELNPNSITVNLKGKKILVVEDVKEIRLYYESLLAPTGAKTYFASNAREARTIFKKYKDLDLILLDIRLPDADGYNLANEFKRINPNIPIIAQTAYALQSEFNKSIESGCDDYVTKPIDANALLKKIMFLLQKKES
ncbi:PAS domain S-box protein [Tenuifilum thalassicum]|uniref:histidine kinase n=1 Tax=Tenuifilum thalassicum TaxID=2590900 RepID=A0A7D4CSC8_9BACT|nr:PAS domain S-box protein [Tenuifilum thalassicum]QKG80765.1 PAS domain S-box protein [Tenuifilum thalassicum]